MKLLVRRGTGGGVSRRVVAGFAALMCACGPPTIEVDGGRDAGRNVGADAGLRDAGVADAAVLVVDAGPPPPPTASGSMTVNGAPLMLTNGFGTPSASSLRLQLNSDQSAVPQLQVTMVLPANASVGVAQLCGGPGVLFTARWIVGGQIAFFTLDQTCEVRLTQLAADAGDDYAGTFSGTATFEPRSALDAGFQVLKGASERL